MPPPWYIREGRGRAKINLRWSDSSEFALQDDVIFGGKTSYDVIWPAIFNRSAILDFAIF